MCSPIEGFSLRELPLIVSSAYNPPPPGSDARHQGVDFAYYRNQGQMTIEGKKVYAILPGKVIGVVENRLPYGNTIVIETRYSDIAPPLAEAFSITRETSLYHLYAHLQDAPLLALGQRIKCGELIGHVGKSGTIVPHLHLETRMGPAGGWLPSMGFFDEDATEEEKANYLFWRISGVYKHFDPMTLFERYLAYESNNLTNLGGE
jgi:murein DD-endopeptidase MepM/ murein hydrolase activator NlpD